MLSVDWEFRSEFPRIAPGLAGANFFFIHPKFGNSTVSNSINVEHGNIPPVAMAFAICHHVITLTYKFERHFILTKFIGG